ncbi:MAG: amidohydrolase family protein [Candidatus Firestonebacteria bacterium]
MELIDVHAHFFPDNIAKNSIEFLEKEAKIKAYGAGTAASLRESMKRDGVTLSINAPVATKKEQVRGINRKMIEFNKTGRDIICFGGMHPDFAEIGNVEEEIAFLSANGIKGIKLHSEYQNFNPDEDRAWPIYEACLKHNLIILFHAGVDFAYETLVRATPERLKKIVTLPGLKTILAHFGSYRMWDEVLKHLAGTPAYFDTAYTAELPEEMCRALIKSHGEDRILFGTDFPWQTAPMIREMLERAVADKEVLEKIYYKNAKKLLGL